jgi:hypothetical protein
MYFKLTIQDEDKTLVWRTEAIDVEDGIMQFETAVLAGEIKKPIDLERVGYSGIEIGWAGPGQTWD